MNLASSKFSGMWAVRAPPKRSMACVGMVDIVEGICGAVRSGNLSGYIHVGLTTLVN
jgi:hypothetical protein